MDYIALTNIRFSSATGIWTCGDGCCSGTDYLNDVKFNQGDIITVAKYYNDLYLRDVSSGFGDDDDDWYGNMVYIEQWELDEMVENGQISPI